jgi:hypothetical protein
MKITTGIYDTFGKGLTGIDVSGPHWERVVYPGEGVAYFCYDRPVSAFDPPDLPPPRIVDILWYDVAPKRARKLAKKLLEE